MSVTPLPFGVGAFFCKTSFAPLSLVCLGTNQPRYTVKFVVLNFAAPSCSKQGARGTLSLRELLLPSSQTCKHTRPPYRNVGSFDTPCCPR